MAHGLSSFTWKESILLAFSPKNVSLSLSLLFAIVVSFENQRRLSEFYTRVAPHCVNTLMTLHAAHIL